MERGSQGAGRSGGWIRALAVLLLLGVAALRVQAAPDVDILQARFGFCDAMIPERWTPVRLTISSAKRPFSGRLIVTHVQDATQSARVMLPVATTPGVATSVEVVLCVPASLEAMAFQFIESETGEARTIKYARKLSAAEADPDVRDLAGLDQEVRSVVVVGRAASLTSSIEKRDPLGAVRATKAEDMLWSWVARGDVEPADMPLAWGAYDAADVVVVRGDLGLGAESRVDPRALEALMAWVRSGGRLVVLVEPAGDGFTRFVDKMSVVEVAEQVQVPAPHRAAGVLGSRVSSRGSVLMSAVAAGEEGGAGVWDFLRGGEPPQGVLVIGEVLPSVEAAALVPARMLKLTQFGASRGWKIEYSGASDTPLVAAGATGVVAHGPVGLGLVMLVSMDPAKATALASQEGATRVWRDVLTPMLVRAHSRTMVVGGNGRFYPYMRIQSSSGSSVESQAAISAVLGSITDVPRLGHEVFIAIAAVVFLLAMMVGPVDAIFLKRMGKRQHSWLTAIGWTALACILSIEAPAYLRSGSNAFFRMAAYDAIAAEDGSIVHASREGMTSLFPGRAGRIDLEDRADGAMHRGASVAGGGRRSEFLGGVLPLMQGVSREGDLRGVVPLPASLRQWSLRATMDAAPAVARECGSLRATFQKLPDAWRLRVEGLPEGSAITAAGVEMKDNRWLAMGPGGSSGVWEAPLDSVSGAPQMWKQSYTPPPANDYGGNWNRMRGVPTAEIEGQGQVLALPGPGMRRDAIERYVQSGSWACVHIQVSGWPSGVVPVGASKGAWNIRSEAVLRILVPARTEWLDQSDSKPADEPAAQPSEPVGVPDQQENPAAEPVERAAERAALQSDSGERIP